MGDSYRDAGPIESIILALVRTTFKCPIAGLSCRSCLGGQEAFKGPEEV